jgi:hypothetical protein
MNAPLKSLVAPVATLAIAIALVHPESAQALNFYTGLDAGAGITDPRPSSDAAANSFATTANSLGTLNTITFDKIPLTIEQNLTIAPGVTASWFNQADFTIFNNPSTLLGYNTTSGGSQFARLAFKDVTQSVKVIFSFATPIQAWGAYFTGVGSADGNTVIEFSDGTIQTQRLAGDRTGGVSFLGFTDPSKKISTITVLQTPVNGVSGDILGIDDLRYVVAVPTPALLPAAVGMAIACWRQKWREKKESGGGH